MEAFAIDFCPLNFEFVLGMSGVSVFGEVFIGADGEVVSGDQNHASMCDNTNGVTAGGVVEETVAYTEVSVVLQTKEEYPKLFKRWILRQDTMRTKDRELQNGNGLGPYTARSGQQCSRVHREAMCE